MTSSDSSSSVRVISSPGSGGASQGDPEANSSGVSLGPPSLVDARVLWDHDLDTTVTEGSLAMIRGRYSIPTEYMLHVPWPGQHPYSSDAPGMCITVDALEADQMDLGDMRGMPKMSSGKAPSTRAAAPAREVDVSPVREAPKASSKRPIDASTEQADDLARQHKKVKVLTRRHKSRHGEGESHSHSKGKEPATPSEEPDMPAESDEGDASLVHHCPRSMKDLFKTKIHKGDAGYYTLHMSDLGHQDLDKEMKARWRGLKNSTKVWNDSSAIEEFERGLLHPQLAIHAPLRGLASPSCQRDDFGNQHFHMALFDQVYYAGRLITFMDYRISQLQQELDTLKSGEGPEAVAKAKEHASELEQELEKTKREQDEASEKELNEVQSNLAEIQRLLKEARVRARKMDDELLQAVKALENARAELPRQAVDRYKESVGFEGLKRMGRVTYEYGYWVALARFHALHPDSEVEDDPFTIHPEDDLVSMERQQVFDDSDPLES
ncbi:hypothetical protein OPV22_007288 [Ensete ventricosum]|uniref:Uncharacterized protein n=1 Tax=Ensete ventricosum TaxID=4639 RepID=A0AAV8RN84_ENSVE|nr:hypothetical protein OPV22_007288 [Ensete ventricosum]